MEILIGLASNTLSWTSATLLGGEGKGKVKLLSPLLCRLNKYDTTEPRSSSPNEICPKQAQAQP